MNLKNLKTFYVKHKKKILTVLRIAISLGLIAYLIFFSSEFKDFNDFVDIIKTINVPILLASASLHIFGTWISSLRWQILLKTQQINISIWFLISSFLIGSFFNNILPTSIGGDVFRTIDVANKAKVSVGKSATIVVVDRFTGVLTAAVYAVIALLLGFTRVGSTSYIIPVVAFFAVCILLGFLILNPSILRLERLVEKIKFLKKIRENLKEVYHTFQSFKQYKLALFKAMICSFALQLAVIASYYLASRALGINLSFASFIFIVPIVSFISMLPISIGGMGVRENSVVFLMAALGAPRDLSAMTSLIIFAIILALGLTGAIVYIVRPFVSKQPNTAAVDTMSEKKTDN